VGKSVSPTRGPGGREKKRLENPQRKIVAHSALASSRYYISKRRERKGKPLMKYSLNMIKDRKIGRKEE